MKHAEIAASLIAADCTRLAAEMTEVSSADWLHVDVMDNHFVPNLGFSMQMVSRIAQASQLPVECHLMIEDTDQWAPRYAAAGAQRVTFHTEAVRDANATAQAIREHGASPALAFNPETEIAHHLDVLEQFDAVLIMTVTPGSGGQTFLPHALANVTTASTWGEMTRAKLVVGVDGGINTETAALAARAGATYFVAGTALFGRTNRAAAIERLRRTATAS